MTETTQAIHPAVMRSCGHLIGLDEAGLISAAQEESLRTWLADQPCSACHAAEARRWNAKRRTRAEQMSRYESR